MESKILYFILRMLEQKEDGSHHVYADYTLVRAILSFIREEELVSTIRKADIQEHQLSAYLEMRLAFLMALSCADCCYYFLHRTTLQELRRLMDYCRKSGHRFTPLQRHEYTVRIRELGSLLGHDPISRALVGEALHYASASQSGN